MRYTILKEYQSQYIVTDVPFDTPVLKKRCPPLVRLRSVHRDSLSNSFSKDVLTIPDSKEG